MTKDESVVIATLQAEVAALRAALREAMEWNWMDDFIPEDIEDRLSKLAEDPGDQEAKKMPREGGGANRHDNDEGGVS